MKVRGSKETVPCGVGAVGPTLFSGRSHALPMPPQLSRATSPLPTARTARRGDLERLSSRPSRHTRHLGLDWPAVLRQVCPMPRAPAFWTAARPTPDLDRPARRLRDRHAGLPNTRWAAHSQRGEGARMETDIQRTFIATRHGRRAQAGANSLRQFGPSTSPEPSNGS